MRKPGWKSVRERKKRKSSLFYLFIILLLLSVNTVFSQKKEEKKPSGTEVSTEKTGDQENKETAASKSEFLKKYSPGLGLMAGVNIPSGDLASALGMGYGGQLSGDIRLPIKLTRSLQYRGRVNAGYYSLPGSGDFSGTFAMIPFIITFEISYPGISGFRPYFGLGGGITYNSVSGDSGAEKVPDGSSVDGSLTFSLGAGYTVRSMPHIEYIVDITHLLVFESVIGQFTAISAGVAYRFRSPWAWLEEGEKDKTGKDKS